jgi:hypothetical protein
VHVSLSFPPDYPWVPALGALAGMVPIEAVEGLQGPDRRRLGARLEVARIALAFLQGGELDAHLRGRELALVAWASRAWRASAEARKPSARSSSTGSVVVAAIIITSEVALCQPPALPNDGARAPPRRSARSTTERSATTISQSRRPPPGAEARRGGPAEETVTTIVYPLGGGDSSSRPPARAWACCFFTMVPWTRRAQPYRYSSTSS